MFESSGRALKELGVFDRMGALFLGEGRHVTGTSVIFSAIGPRVRKILEAAREKRDTPQVDEASGKPKV